MTTETPITITFTAVDDYSFGKRWCDLCGDRADPGYGEDLYTFTHPLQAPDDGDTTDACHVCAHADTDRHRARAAEQADRLEARAAELLGDWPKVRAAELMAEAATLRQVMGTAEYVTIESSDDPWADVLPLPDHRASTT